MSIRWTCCEYRALGARGADCHACGCVNGDSMLSLYLWLAGKPVEWCFVSLFTAEQSSLVPEANGRVTSTA